MIVKIIYTQYTQLSDKSDDFFKNEIIRKLNQKLIPVNQIELKIEQDERNIWQCTLIYTPTSPLSQSYNINLNQIDNLSSAPDATKNIINTAYLQIKTNLLNYIKEMTNISKHNKYLKYKNKYLQLKKLHNL